MEKLNAWLEENKASDLAERLGVTKGYIWQLRKGRTSISLRRAFQIEDATNGAVPARSWLIDDPAGGGQ
jgi:DNA-binding transcriptional regulator YdaS (Cro superfamily)